MREIMNFAFFLMGAGVVSVLILGAFLWVESRDWKM